MGRDGVPQDVIEGDRNELRRGRRRVRGDREALSRGSKADGASSPWRVRDVECEQWELGSGERPASERGSADPHRVRAVLTGSIRREVRLKNFAVKN
jgi:hypothetical protein